MFETITNNYKNLSLALGFFDGVHLGHQEVILNAVKIAKEVNQKSAVVTFNSHPLVYFNKNIEYISIIEKRNELIHDLGVDYIFSLDFDNKLAQMDCKEYLDFLAEKFSPIAITTGFNHTFGKFKCGTPDFLRLNQIEYNYNYYEIPQKILNNEIISSSLIRQKLLNGDIESANSLLGRCFSFKGIVIKGRQLGRQLGFPTVNILYPKELVNLPFGVYSVDIVYNNKILSGIMNYGVKPTIDNNTKTPLTETFIFDFSEDIYCRELEIRIKKFIRAEKKFESIEELKAQIKKDIEKC